jgi:23S rRNA (adenine-N6)-dimethyltransferase
VVKADASDLRLPRRPFRVVANPPFAITTGLLRRLTAPGSRLVRGDLVVPVFMADRWAHGHAPGAGRWRSTYAATVTARVPSRCFRPSGPPAAVLTIEGTGRDR